VTFYALLTVDNAQSHVTAFRPISEAARSWSGDNVHCNDSVIIHNDDDNLSDHLAIECSFHIESLSPCAGDSYECLASRKTLPKLLWERANVSEYQYLINMYLSGITLPNAALSCNGQGRSGHKDHIEIYYNDIVRCLAAASQCVPCTRVGVAKH